MDNKAQEAERNKVSWLLKRLKTAEDYCRPYFDRAKRHYQLYRFSSSVKESDWPYVNRVRSRDILAFVEDSTAIMVQTLFSTIPFFSIIPRQVAFMRVFYENIDPQAIGRQVERCLDYQLCHEDTQFFEEMVDYFKSGCMFGNAYEGVFPRFEVDGTYLRPQLKTADFWDVLPIVGASRLTRSKGVFYREFMAPEDLEDMQNKGIYKKTDLRISSQSTATDPEIQWHRNLLAELGMEDYLPDDENIECLHYFSGGHVISMANRKDILRDSTEPVETGQVDPQGNKIMLPVRPYPYDMPIVQYKYMPVPCEFFSMGIPEVLEVLQEDKNLIRSARRDNIDLVINKIIKARAGADINYDLIKYYAGAIWPLENLKDIEPLEQRDVTESSYSEEGLIQKDMENALSFFGYARGMTPEHTERPTTVIRLQEASMNRQDLSIKLAEFTTLQNIAMRIVLLTRKYMSQGDYEAIIGEKDAGFYRLTEEHLRRFFYIKPVGSSVTHVKEIRQAQMQFMLDTLTKIPPELAMNSIEPFTINWYEAVRSSLDAADIKNIDRILISMKRPPPEPVMFPSVEQINELAGIGYGGM